MILPNPRVSLSVHVRRADTGSGGIIHRFRGILANKFGFTHLLCLAFAVCSGIAQCLNAVLAVTNICIAAFIFSYALVEGRTILKCEEVLFEIY